jgi:Putative metal-binding motif/Stigma-specific protein, Stig1
MLTAYFIGQHRILLGARMSGNRLPYALAIALFAAGCGGGGGYHNSDGGNCAAVCSGKCVDTATDPNNCGGCGTICTQGRNCVGGMCTFGGCTKDTDCDDKINCTLDTCSSGYCRHAVGANVGPTACPLGQFCVLGKGCIKGKACGSSADCADMDPCTVFEECQAATAICTYAILDRDDDGHPPVVCGGDDCDDSDPDRFPGHKEVCDGVDNACTGMVDVGATCESSFQACQSGMCQCKPEFKCGGGFLCADEDPKNCGACGNVCAQGSVCTAGKCSCPNGLMDCGGSCADLRSDPNNCGMCGMGCGPNSTCSQSVCRCNFNYSDCGGLCANLKTDPANCGMCGVQCANGKNCSAGLCQLGCLGIINCQNMCGGMNPCFNDCYNRGTFNAQNLYDAVIDCLNTACPGNLQNDPCWDPQSQTCKTCWSTAQMQGGKCATQLKACQQDT